MNTLFKVLAFVTSIFITLQTKAQDTNGVAFIYSQARMNDGEVLLTIKAVPQKDNKLYALQKKENDVLYSSIIFDSSFSKYLDGTIAEKGISKTERDLTVNATVNYFTDTVLWQQKIKLPSAD